MSVIMIFPLQSILISLCTKVESLVLIPFSFAFVIYDFAYYSKLSIFVVTTFREKNIEHIIITFRHFTFMPEEPKSRRKM